MSDWKSCETTIRSAGERIDRAAKIGKGVHLTAHEVHLISISNCFGDGQAIAPDNTCPAHGEFDPNESYCPQCIRPIQTSVCGNEGQDDG